MTDKPPDKPDPAPQADVPIEPPAAPLPVLSYATPSAYDLGVWRSGSYVVVSSGADLANRCVKCNGATSVQIPLHIGGQWGLQISAGRKWPVKIVSLRGATLHIGLCRRCAIERHIARIITALLALGLGAGDLYMMYAYPPGRDDLMIGSFLGGLLQCLLGGFLLFTLCYVAFHKPLSAKNRLTGIWLRHSGRKFRDSLPPLKLPGDGHFGWLRGKPPSGEI
jgi:hypothetical protein